jgi:hypothetical protein
MDISEQEIRDMVRAALTRQGGGRTADEPPAADSRQHASHGLLALVKGGDADGQCLIEPGVRCNHCNYCQSLGH